MADSAENGLPGTCPKCGSQTPIGHRCIVDDLAAIRDADLSDHPLMQAIKGAAPAESDPVMRAFVAGWFAHARNPERLVVEDAWRAYQRVLPPAEKCGVCGATRDEPEKCGYPGGCPIPPADGATDE